MACLLVPGVLLWAIVESTALMCYDMPDAINKGFWACWEVISGMMPTTKYLYRVIRN